MIKTNKKSLWDRFGKWNFAIFFRLVQKISMRWGRHFLYVGLEDKSIYEEEFADPILNISVLKKNFPNPIGIAPGFDKSFKFNDELIRFGFGFEEFGTFTIASNHRSTQLQYLSSQKALFVNVPYFENPGIRFAQKGLINRRHLPYIAGVSIASNFEITHEQEDSGILYEQIEKELVECVQHVAPYCDYIVVNLSHPQLPISTLALNGELLEKIIRRLQEVIRRIAPIADPALLIKLPLDISQKYVPLLAESLLNSEIDGIVIGGYLNPKQENRKLLKQNINGYICGAPIKDATTQIVGQFYTLTQGKIPIIASGGVFTGDDAFEKIKAGASLVQIHTAIIYEGPSIGRRINERLAELLRENGFHNVQEAVGTKFKRIIATDANSSQTESQ